MNRCPRCVALGITDLDAEIAKRIEAMQRRDDERWMVEQAKAWIRDAIDHEAFAALDDDADEDRE
jgi:hypothetical protein